MSENELFYSEMAPSDFYSRVDNYLNNQGKNISPKNDPSESAVFFYQNPTLAPTSHFEGKNSGEPYKNLQKQQHYETSACTGSLNCSSFTPTPRIGHKIACIEQKDLTFKNVVVRVAEVGNPSRFYLVLQENSEEYEILKAALKQFYETNAYPLPIKSNFYYAAKFDDEWGRVKILNCLDNFCCCLFIDEGITRYLTDDKLFLLDDRFKTLPPRSFRASLIGIGNGESWSQNVINRFRSMVKEKTLTAFIKTQSNPTYDTEERNGSDDRTFQCELSNEDIDVNKELTTFIFSSRQPLSL